MAINDPRISGKPAVERRRVTKYQPIETSVASPDGTVVTVDDQGLPSIVRAPEANREGQVYVHTFTDDTGLNRRAQMYVAIDMDGTLTWKVVSNITSLNKWTGQPYDPIFDA